MESTRSQSDPGARRQSRPPRATGPQAAALTRSQNVEPRARLSLAATERNANDDHDGAPRRRPTSTVVVPRAPGPAPFPRGLRRLRDRLQTREDGLRLDVNALKQEIIDLNVQRLVLNTKHAVQRRLLLQTAVEGVVEYFGAFQHGWILESATTDQHIAELQASLSATRSFVMVRSPRQEREQAAFLRERQRLLSDRQQHFVATVLDPTMTCGPFHHGVDAFVHQWKRFSEHHRLARLTLTCMTCHGSPDEPIVIAQGTFSGTLTQKALEEAFPRAMTDPRLTRRLVGAAIRYPSREIFHFGRTGLITRYDRGLDYVQAFASLFGNLEDVAIVLEGATRWDEDAEEDADYSRIHELEQTRRIGSSIHTSVDSSAEETSLVCL